MGREINVSAESRLNLRDAIALDHAYATILKAAFEQRLGQVGGTVAMLDSVVEIAHDAGYKGTLDQAAMIFAKIALRIGGSIEASAPLRSFATYCKSGCVCRKR